MKYPNGKNLKNGGNLENKLDEKLTKKFDSRITQNFEKKFEK